MGDLNYNTGAFHYPSRRELVYGKKGMVATSHPIAAQVGLDILKKGGNAIDAAIATAATLTVVEPGSNGIGGDSFSIIWKDGQLHGLNSSGPSAEEIDTEKYLSKEKAFPTFGIKAANVPGVPAGWVALNEKHGKLPLEDLLEPAAKIAEEGFVITQTVGQAFDRTFKRFSKERVNHPELESWFEVFAPDGKPMKPLDILKLKGHARGLRLIAETKGEAFYEGEIARQIDEFSKKYSGYLRLEDLEGYQPEWVDPVSVDYRGHQIWEMPPNGQGIVTLMALNTLKHLELKGKDDPETVHQQIEAMKLAFADGNLTITDSDTMRVSNEKLLSDAYAQERAKIVGHDAIEAEPGIRDSSGTVYLATADSEGNMVSYIQSNYMGFGSGAVIPEYGISLNNRAVGFSLEKDHVNCLAPGKRPFNTIIPGFITREHKPLGPFGVMGGHMQPQGHLQVVQSMLDFNLNPQDALDAPRWQWVKGKKVLVELTMPLSVIADLKNRGHQIEVELEKGQFGRGQIILRTDKGVLVGGTEPRTDGSIAVW